MPTFRNRNSGQVVTVEVDPSHLSGLARWERIEEYLTPAFDPAAPTVVFAEPEPAVVEQPETPAKPADDADRDEWIAYAKAHGKTDADLKGVRTTVIRGWFE